MLKALRRGPSERGPGFKAGVAVGACLAFLALSALRAAAPAAGPAPVALAAGGPAGAYAAGGARLRGGRGGGNPSEGEGRHLSCLRGAQLKAQKEIRSELA